jgi:hypothetical protein
MIRRCNVSNNVLTDNLSVPLNGTTTARVDINSGTGHLTIDPLAGDESLLASGTLQFLEKQGVPARSLDSGSGQSTLRVRAGEGGIGQHWFRLPWEFCGGAYEWQVYLNPRISCDINAHSDGGNVKLDLAGMAVTHVAADTGGGNMEVVLPDNATDLSAAASTGGGNVTVEIGRGITGNSSVDAKSGAGNVVVRVPSGLAARVRADSGLGKVTVDPRFSTVDGHTYQTPDYEGAADKVEIIANSGAGNVSIITK